MKRSQSRGSLILPVLLLLFFGCTKEIGKESSIDSEQALATKAITSPSSSTEKMLQTDLQKAVHSATARYHSTTQAIKAGYVPDTRCVAAPGLGGMGYHWVNPSLIDPVFDPLTPEVLLYAAGPGGKLKLVAVEYLVIRGTLAQPRPKFDDQLFDIGSGAPIPVYHWSLHVWLHENNPAGIFMPFNPNIMCP
jgi:hypothetical protein